MAAQTQTALLLTELGKPLTKTSIPIPEPKEDELLIKITSTGIAPLDSKLWFKNIFNIPLPCIITYDLVGVVVAHGPGVDTSILPVGSNIMTVANFTPMSGGLQEYVCVPSKYSCRVPPNISATDAAAFPINAGTSFIALFSKNGLDIPFPGTEKSKGYDYSTQKLVIVGGGSNCGQLAIELAHIVGIGEIITVAGIKGEAELKALGATHVIDRRAPNVVTQVRAIVGDECIYVYDTVTQPDLSLPVSLLSNSKKGTLAHLVTGVPSEEVLKQKKEGYEDKRIFGLAQSNLDVGALYWEALPKWLEDGKLKVSKYRVIEGLDVEKISAVLKEGLTLGGGRWHVKL